jgi:hypothetical protein
MLCATDQVGNDEAQQRLRQDVEHMQMALAYDADLSRAVLLSRHTFMVLRETKLAVQSFSAFTRLRPGNPLGHLEAGLAQGRWYRAQFANEVSNSQGAVAF